MKKLILALLLLTTPAYADAVNHFIDQTNFLVDDNCSGTLIDKDQGMVLTAAHCVRDMFRDVERETIQSDGTIKKEKVRVARPGTVSQITFLGPNEVQRNVYVFKIVDIDRDNDLALLKVQTKLPNDAQATLACSAPERMQTVFAVGNSFGVLYSSVSQGIVSSLHRSYRDLKIAGQLGDDTDSGEHGLVQHTAVIAPGNSGGALYDSDWKFVGVNVRAAAALGGYGFAVPLQDIEGFLKKNSLEKLVCKKE